MAGYFEEGENKIRPGSYFNVNTTDKLDIEIINGVTVVIFRSSFGPLGYAVEFDPEEDYKKLYGTEGTTDAIDQAIKGGAKKIIACRLGDGGTKSFVYLENSDGEKIATLSTTSAGSKSFTVSIREKLTDSTKKECIIYTGTKIFETFEFGAGSDEMKFLSDEISASSINFVLEPEEGKEKELLANVLQKEFEGGTDPAVTVDSYSDAFEQVESFKFNTICLDTEDPEIHLMLDTFLERLYKSGSLAQAVIAEKTNIGINTRINKSAQYNDEKIVYLLNSKVKLKDGSVIEGYQTAARIAGMVGSVPCNQSLTHTIISDFVELGERMTDVQIKKAILNGCFVLSTNSKNKVWIEYAITTLVDREEHPNLDNGWKKIRRTKTRFELLRRCNDVTDSLVGKVDNDENGRKTIMSQIMDVCASMVTEGKLKSYSVSESKKYIADGDSCWFDIDIVDKDSAEHIYSFFNFKFSTRV